jgi:hypothetical protein
VVEGCRPDELPLPFRPFLARIEQPLCRLQVVTEPPARTSGRVVADAEVWRLTEGSRLGGLRMEGFAPPVQGTRALIQVELSPDWCSGEIRFDAAFAPPPLVAAPLASPLGELLILSLLNRDRGLYVHASSARWADGVDVFLGRSGAGKSTLAALCEAAGADILSDDRTVLSFRHGRLWAAGTPFHGTGLRWSAGGGPVRGLYFLEHGPDTAARRLDLPAAAPRLMATTFTEFWCASALARSLRMCAQACGAVPSFRFRFKPDAAAVRTLAEVALAA